MHDAIQTHGSRPERSSAHRGRGRCGGRVFHRPVAHAGRPGCDGAACAHKRACGAGLISYDLKQDDKFAQARLTCACRCAFRHCSFHRHSCNALRGSAARPRRFQRDRRIPVRLQALPRPLAGICRDTGNCEAPPMLSAAARPSRVFFRNAADRAHRQNPPGRTRQASVRPRLRRPRSPHC